MARSGWLPVRETQLPGVLDTLIQNRCIDFAIWAIQRTKETFVSLTCTSFAKNEGLSRRKGEFTYLGIRQTECSHPPGA